MNREVVQVQLRAVLPLEGSFAVFMGTQDKTFVIYVDENVGTAISMFMRGVPKDRPLTHDLFGHVLMAFGAKVERVIINKVEGSIFHARLILTAENQLHTKKVVELDARPSDSIALATASGADIFVAADVWEEVEDVTETLAQIESQGAFASSETAAKDTEGLDPDLLSFDDELLEEIAGEGEDFEFDEDEEEGDDEDGEGEEWKKG